MFKTDLQAATGPPVWKYVWYKKVQKETAKERPEFCFFSVFLWSVWNCLQRKGVYLLSIRKIQKESISNTISSGTGHLQP